MRLGDRAAREQAKADDRYAASRKIADGIPFGQPILLGHHSQARAERDARKIRSHMDASIEHQERTARAATAAATAAAATSHRHNPVTVANRLERLGADIRRMERTLAQALAAGYQRQDLIDRLAIDRADLEHVYTDPTVVIATRLMPPVLRVGDGVVRRGCGLGRRGWFTAARRVAISSVSDVCGPSVGRWCCSMMARSAALRYRVDRARPLSVAIAANMTRSTVMGQSRRRRARPYLSGLCRWWEGIGWRGQPIQRGRDDHTGICSRPRDHFWYPGRGDRSKMRRVPDMTRAGKVIGTCAGAVLAAGAVAAQASPSHLEGGPVIEVVQCPGGGTVTFTKPGKGFDPLTATDDALQANGLPPRPSTEDGPGGKEALAAWTKMVTGVITYIPGCGDPTAPRVDRSHGLQLAPH